MNDMYAKNTNEILQALAALLQGANVGAGSNATDDANSANTDTGNVDTAPTNDIPANNITINRVIGSGANKPSAPRRKARPFESGQEVEVGGIKVTIVENRPRKKVHAILAWGANKAHEIKLLPEGLLVELAKCSQAPSATKTPAPANAPAKTPAKPAPKASAKSALTEDDKDSMALSAIQAYCDAQHIAPAGMARHVSQNTAYVWTHGQRIHLNPKTGAVKSVYPAGDTLTSWQALSKYKFF